VPLYFAYGSNLDESQLQRRCPGATLVTVGSLPDFRLEFTVRSAGWNAGVADVVESPGDRVWGLVFDLMDQDLESLDRFEGYPHQYGRFIAQIDTPRGMLDAWVYTVTRKQPFVAPARRYVEIIRRAALRHGFPDTYLRMLDGVTAVDP
jgi:gamma-glutamylcyclotransferase (GGCT)/AIG2-like uncharacterized protein YtfP